MKVKIESVGLLEEFQQYTVVVVVVRAVGPQLLKDVCEFTKTP